MKVTVGKSNRLSVGVSRPGRVLVDQSGLVSRSLNDLVDVDTTTKTDGSLLIYDETQRKFTASTLLEKQTLNGGNF
jgi:hypothetical protein